VPRRSPTLEGFRVLFRMPLVGLAEITWRWAIGTALVASIIFATLQYLKSLPVANGDMLLLRTRHPLLVSRALAHIFAGTAVRFLMVLVILALAVALAWIVIAAIGRAMTVKILVAYFFPERIVKLRIGPIIELNSLRATALLAAIVATAGAMLLAGMTSTKADPSPGSAMLIFATLSLFIWICWAMLNWLMSLATIFVVVENQPTSGAIVAAVDLIRQRTGPVLAASVWFGLAHGVAYTIASSAIGFPLAFTGLLPGGIVLGGVILAGLLYFAVVDYLYIGRLAAYIIIAEGQEAPAVLHPTEGPAGIDPTELILSDLSLGEAPA
jgi:hypothetical protein